MPNLLKQLRITSVDFVDRGANPLAHITLMKRDDRMPDKPEVLPVDVEAFKALEAKVTKAEAGIVSDEDKTLLKRIGAFLMPKADPTPDEKLTVELAKRDEKIAALEAAIAKGTADASKAAFIAKASGIALLGKDGPEALWAVSQAVGAEKYASIEKSLRAAQSQVDMGVLLKEFGVDGGDEATPEAKLDRMAAEMVTKKDGLTPARAMAAALETPEGKALYAEMTNTGRGGR